MPAGSDPDGGAPALPQTFRPLGVRVAAVAFGVLLDTIIVRSILVPALTFGAGRRIWWPSRLSRTYFPVPEPAAANTREPQMVGRR